MTVSRPGPSASRRAGARRAPPRPPLSSTTFMRRSYVRAALPRWGEHRRHQRGRAGLGERLVEVAALRRLHARRTAALARTLAHEPVRVAHQRLEGLEA